MLQKFSVNKTNRMLNDLIRKREKNWLKQTELQLAVVLALREHTKTRRSFFSLNKAMNQWLIF